MASKLYITLFKLVHKVLYFSFLPSQVPPNFPMNSDLCFVDSSVVAIHNAVFGIIMRLVLL